MIHDLNGNEMCVMQIRQVPGKTIYVECNGIIHTSTFTAPKGSKIRAWAEYPNGRREPIKLRPMNEGSVSLSSLTGLNGSHLVMDKKEEPKPEEKKELTEFDKSFSGDEILPVAELPKIL